MRVSTFIFILFYTSVIAQKAKTHKLWAVELYHASTHQPYSIQEAQEYAQQHGFLYQGPVQGLRGIYLLQANEPVLYKRQEMNESLEKVVESQLTDSPPVVWYELQVPVKRVKRAINSTSQPITFKDPLYSQQWHLNNTLHKGSDINVIPVWNMGYNGSHITVSVIDDGVDYEHPDLMDAWSMESSFNFNEKNQDPRPRADDENHGTRCAGEIAARPNAVCGVGVAFGAKIAAEKLIGNATMDSTEASALLFKNQMNHIYSSSWGPDDDGKTVDGPGRLAKEALMKGVTEGRSGLGSIFVFASGNGGDVEDNCNYDGYANSIYTVSIGAIDENGALPSYGEQCSAHLAVTFSGSRDEKRGITTTDISDKCTSSHSGTSAAAPLASGMFALLLQARPELSWRDVQHIIVNSAKMTDHRDSDWVKNGAGKMVSHKYGFGKLDATSLMNNALKHQLVPLPAMEFSANIQVEDQISIDYGLESSVYVDGDTGIESLEHVQVMVDIDHPWRGSLQIVLTSPSGTPSVLAAPRRLDTSSEGYKYWTFMSIRHWHERPQGTWKLHLVDTRDSSSSMTPGILHSWKLKLYGLCHPQEMVEEYRNITDPLGYNRPRLFRTCHHTLQQAQVRRKNMMIAAILISACGMAAMGLYLVYRYYYTPTSYRLKEDMESPIKGRNKGYIPLEMMNEDSDATTSPSLSEATPLDASPSSVFSDNDSPLKRTPQEASFYAKRLPPKWAKSLTESPLIHSQSMGSLHQAIQPTPSHDNLSDVNAGLGLRRAHSVHRQLDASPAQATFQPYGGSNVSGSGQVSRSSRVVPSNSVDFSSPLPSARTSMTIKSDLSFTARRSTSNLHVQKDV